MLELQENHHIHHVKAGEGAPIIFVHGATGSMDNWAANIPEIAKAGYSAYAVDLLGHGASGKPDEPEAYHIEKVYSHLVSWIDEFEIPKPINLVGHSIGAHLILVYALRNPGAVRKLVLVNPFYAPDQQAAWLKYWGKRPEMGVKMMQAASKNVLNPFRRWRRDVTNKWTANKIKMAATDLQRMHPNIFYTTSSIWDLSPQLSALDVETLVVWGKKDRTLSPKSFPKLIEKLPKVESLEMRDCGHTPHIDESVRFNRRVIEFLS